MRTGPASPSICLFGALWKVRTAGLDSFPLSLYRWGDGGQRGKGLVQGQVTPGVLGLQLGEGRWALSGTQ